MRLRRSDSSRAIDNEIRNYRIATPSCAKSSGSSGTDECADATGEIDERIKRLRNVDVMFVMDATQSMDPYFPAARKALEQFVSQLQQSQDTGVTVRVAVHIYGDYKGNEADPKSIDYLAVIPFLELARLKDEFGRLDSLTMFSDTHTDKPEASFAALIRAASSTSWGRNSGVRYIVHIGDHGNRDQGKTSGTGTSSLTEKLAEEDVASQLLAKGIIYVPIPVLGTYDAANNSAFVDQARRLTKLMPSQSIEVRPTYRSDRPQEAEADRISAILAAMKDGVKISKEAREAVGKAIVCAQNPENPLCRDQGAGSGSGGWKGEVVVRELLARAGLSAEEVNRIYGRSQTVGTFYFKPLASDGSQLFKYYIAIEADPLRRLVRIGVELCETIDNSAGSRVLQRALSETLNVVIDSQNSLADIMASRLFIPAFHFNPLLLKPWGQLEDELRHLRGTPRMDPIKQGFCRSARLLGWVLEGKRVADVEGSMTWDANEKVWKARDRALRDYSWVHDGRTGVPLYYVPIEFLPR